MRKAGTEELLVIYGQILNTTRGTQLIRTRW